MPVGIIGLSLNTASRHPSDLALLRLTITAKFIQRSVLLIVNRSIFKVLEADTIISYVSREIDLRGGCSRVWYPAMLISPMSISSDQPHSDVNGNYKMWRFEHRLPYSRTLRPRVFASNTIDLNQTFNDAKPARDRYLRESRAIFTLPFLLSV